MTEVLTGKHAVVTGAGSGMGREIAKLFAAEGATVAALDVVEAGVSQTVNEIRSAGGHATAFVADISDSASVSNVVESIVSEFGTVDVLINNAGIFDENAALLETSEALWDRVLTVDVKGMFLLTKALMPTLQKQDHASIVNTASIAGVVAHAGGIAYTVAKHGVIGFTQSVAADFGPSIRANAVLPGLVRTPMTEDPNDEAGRYDAVRTTPAGRAAEPVEVAQAVLFLASDQASFIYGAQLAVDGGWTVSRG